MKITKYTQSCLRIEDSGHALLVDVGSLTTADYTVEDFGAYDAVLFTHSHPDHFDPSKLTQLAAGGAAIYGNANVAAEAGEHRIEVVEDNEELVVAGFKIKALRMEHCAMTNGSSAGIPNTAYLINDRLLLPGDSTEDIGVKAEIVAAPVFGPDISVRDAFDLVRSTQAKSVIPVHYDGAGMKPGTFEFFASLGGPIDFTVHSLNNGDSVEL